MNDVQQAIDSSIIQIEKLKNSLKRSSTRQVAAIQEKGIIKATALAWFNNVRPIINSVFSNPQLEKIDQIYTDILVSSEKATSRTRYIDDLKVLKERLVALRSESVLKPIHTNQPKTSDAPPDFSSLVADAVMQDILKRRWIECIRCIAANAPLAATVMMGGLLEALLLARVNRESNKAPIFKSSAAPKDKAGQPLQLREWGLSNYIDVAHELGWITKSAKEISVVLRDYRNYVHPYKELSHATKLEKNDAAILWEVSKSISAQILISI